MKILTLSVNRGLILTFLLALGANTALAGANPDPKPVHIEGPIPWNVLPVQCDAFGPGLIMVDSRIEELWGHLLGEFAEGFTDGSGGWHIVQPAHWIMSASSLSGEYSWWGRAAAHAVGNSPSQTNGSNFGYVAHSIMRADGDWPDLKLKMTFRTVVDANGNVRVFDDMLQISCF